MALKLDFEKAFDLLNWDYIKGCLTKFGFDPHWINLTMECITSASFSIMFNGRPKGYFYPSRGIRQGDPFVLIFLFCV
jgi:hypothetical protein